MNKKILASLLLFLLVSGPMALAGPSLCRDLFYQDHQDTKKTDKSDKTDKNDERKFPKPSTEITSSELSAEAAHKMITVPEFQFIRAEAEKRGIRVWLFGGTASSYLHYVKWNLRREKGLNQLQADRFDFDYTNIFRSTQDLDIVVDGSAEQAREFQKTIAGKFPHFLGAKAAKWEVRTLRARMGQPGQVGYKEALLGDEDFNRQNSDSNSLGMVEVTHSKEPVVRDLRHWDSVNSPFLQDALNDRISFFRSRQHFTTSRAKAGENPEILSVIRLLVKAFQYELTFSENEFIEMKAIVDQFDPKQLQNAAAKHRLEETAIKLVMHATNIEYAMDQLDRLGLRKKLIEMGAKNKINSMSWWLYREPLRSKPVGQGKGQTAKELGIKVVAHETISFLAYESITRAHSGEPNVLESRRGTVGEAAAFGDGFYTRIGRKGAVNSGLTIRFTIDPNAREGVLNGSVDQLGDFTRQGDYIIFHNKKALKVIPESLNLSLNDLINMAQSEDNAVDHSNLALIEKFKRQLNVAKVTDDLQQLLESKTEEDLDKLIYVLSGFQYSNIEKLISKEVFEAVAKNIFLHVSSLAQSSDEKDIVRYIRTVGSILKTIDSLELLKSKNFFDHLKHLIQTPTTGFEIKKQAVFELMQSNENLEKPFNFRNMLSPTRAKEIEAEVSQWQNSLDIRKKKFAQEQIRQWLESNENGDVDKLQVLYDSVFFNLNYKNISGYSTLLLADYFEQKPIIDWLIKKSDFDFSEKDQQGYNQLEQLLLIGKTELVDEIKKARPEVSTREIIVRERNEDGSPIIDFVPIVPKKYIMGSEKFFPTGELMIRKEKQVLVTLTKPFEILSTPTTNKIWHDLTELLKETFPGEFDDLNSSPKHLAPPIKKPTSGLHKLTESFNHFFRKEIPEELPPPDPETLPVVQVSHTTVSKWLEGVNKLSKTDDEKIQATLLTLFPRHKKGDSYELPTEAEREFVQRNQGLAVGKYSFGNSDKRLSESAWVARNMEEYYIHRPVGGKKPIMVNGRPVYDVQGLVEEWVKNLDDEKVHGGIDPQGADTGWSHRIVRGHGIISVGISRSDYGANYERNSHHKDSVGQYISLGFRIIRRSNQ